ncbi:MAG: ABC transporter ATP-binding protein [bacterium]
MSEKAIEISDVTKRYRKNHFFKTKVTVGVQGLTLNIFKGEIYCLLGLNGAGKTTTVKLILNLIFPDSGKIFVFGEKLTPSVISRIGYVSESPYLFPDLTGMELLDLMGILSGMGKKARQRKIGELMEFLTLADFVKRKIKEYSKGMQQRILLAQSLLHDPDILIMDEPYSGLDPVGIAEMRNYIKELNASGKTIFLTSHLIAETEKVATRAGILKNGKIAREVGVVQGRLEEEFLEAVL